MSPILDLYYELMSSSHCWSFSSVEYKCSSSQSDFLCQHRISFSSSIDFSAKISIIKMGELNKIKAGCQIEVLILMKDYWMGYLLYLILEIIMKELRIITCLNLFSILILSFFSDKMIIAKTALGIVILGLNL